VFTAHLSEIHILRPKASPQTLKYSTKGRASLVRETEAEDEVDRGGVDRDGRGDS